MASLRLKIDRMDEVGSQLAFSLCESASEPKFYLQCTQSVVGREFAGLGGLSVCQYQSFTIESAIGIMITSNESFMSMLGHILDFDSLSSLSERSFLLDPLQMFLQACCCVFPWKLYAIGANGEPRDISRPTVEMSSSTLWTILFFAELLKAERVMVEAKKKLAQLCLDVNVFAQSLQFLSSQPSTQTVHKMREGLLRHLLQFEAPKLAESQRVVAVKTVEMTPERRSAQRVPQPTSQSTTAVSGHSPTSVMMTMDELDQPPVNMAVDATKKSPQHVEHSNAARDHHNYEQQSHHDHRDDDYDDDAPRLSTSHHNLMPPPPPVVTAPPQTPRPHTSNTHRRHAPVDDTSSQRRMVEQMQVEQQLTLEHQTQPQQQPQQLLSQPQQQRDRTPRRLAPTAAAITSQLHTQTQTQTQTEPSYAQSQSSSQPQSHNTRRQTHALTQSQERPQSARSQSPYHTQPQTQPHPLTQSQSRLAERPRWSSSSTPTAPRSATPPPRRTSSPHPRGRDAQRTPSRTPSRTSSPHPLPDEQQEVTEGGKGAQLSAQDLQLSREIALLRLRQTKIRRDLETSRLQAQQALRETQLRSLELKTAVLRVSRPADTRSSHNSRSNRSGHSRDRHAQERERERLQREAEDAEEARLRALQRLRQSSKQHSSSSPHSQSQGHSHGSAVRSSISSSSGGQQRQRAGSAPARSSVRGSARRVSFADDGDHDADVHTNRQNQSHSSSSVSGSASVSVAGRATGRAAAQSKPWNHSTLPQTEQQQNEQLHSIKQHAQQRRQQQTQAQAQSPAAVDSARTSTSKTVSVSVSGSKGTSAQNSSTATATTAATSASGSVKSKRDNTQSTRTAHQSTSAAHTNALTLVTAHRLTQPLGDDADLPSSRAPDTRQWPSPEQLRPLLAGGDEARWELQVTLLRAWSLGECLGGTHPYVLLSVLDPAAQTLGAPQRQRSSTQQHSTQPVFMQRFRFPLRLLPCAGPAACSAAERLSQRCRQTLQPFLHPDAQTDRTDDPDSQTQQQLGNVCSRDHITGRLRWWRLAEEAALRLEAFSARRALADEPLGQAQIPLAQLLDLDRAAERIMSSDHDAIDNNDNQQHHQQHDIVETREEVRRGGAAHRYSGSAEWDEDGDGEEGVCEEVQEVCAGEAGPVYLSGSRESDFAGCLELSARLVLLQRK